MAEVPPGLITMGSEPLKQYRARHNFEGSKDDELNFQKGDIITVTLQVPGGWWEGMLSGRSGWFPSNFVREIKPKNEPSETKIVNDVTLGTDQPIDKLKYHTEVIESLLETEKQLTSELQTLISTYLRPLESSNILTLQDWSTLCSNLDDLLTFQHNLTKSIEEAGKLEGKHRRIGACFMKVSTQYRTLYSIYCANHPRAGAVLSENGDELSRFMESKGAPSPGIMFLTTGLSSPFRKMEKYTAVLKELERHLPAGHPDKIDMSTAISVYKEIATYCQAMRKRKEIELDIMTGPIQGWEGDEIHHLGEVIEMTQGAVYIDGAKCERFFLVFHQCFIMLSPTSGMNGFIFLGRYPVTSVRVNRLPDTEKEQGAFELSAQGLEKTKIICPAVLDREQLFDAIEVAPSRVPQKNSTPMPSPGLCGSPPPVPPAAGKPGAPNSLPDSNHITSNSPILANCRDLASPVPMAMRHGNVITCLRPAPPINPMTIWARKEGSGKSPRGKRRNLTKKKDKGKGDKNVEAAIIQKLDSQVLEEDNRILKVIEAYCTSAGSRNASNSVPLEAAPHVFLAEDEKIMVEETKGSETVVEEKTLVDTVYALRDQVKDLMDETKRLKCDLDDERKARRRLETSVRHSIAKYDKEETNL
ncbi:rho guanine nucleotide exchange factor 7 isoform X1 [Strongylocentrotus purpuratus]|uniref:Rho guanine nucleotide exchange factor 7 n=1 Tax=Strongylocentrotus purpuratus TaxID=7668 RepID=A0A7M7GL19_STRPU|nr:rho guanine nucleotide exchange factor 7 isoform X1 [Strongylocentrotus purpuratus]|eukprot:XP_003726562.1 PREDICTED: rho guanine nucleotide exchange factor 7 isoform X1 [Strongylocentrotus purpuratus]